MSKSKRPCSVCGKPLRVTPKSLPEPTCHECRRGATATHEWRIPPSRRVSCASCGKVVQRSSTSAAAIYCLTCRRAGHAPPRAGHGTTRRWRTGCRCAPCCEAKARENRAYVERRGYRTEARTCDECSSEFETRKDRPTRFCSLTCANESRRGTVHSSRFRIRDRDRLAIYVRDNWTCQICSEPVDLEADYLTDWAPTLDHVVPRSKGGSDDPENLRTAHRWCNSVRGDLSFHTDADLREAV